MQIWLQIAATEVAVAGFFLTLLVAAAGLFFAFCILDRDKADRPLLGAIALATAPVLVAFIAWLLLRYAPASLPHRAYLAIPIAAVAFGAPLLAMAADRMFGVREVAAATPTPVVREGFVLRSIGVLAAAIVVFGILAATALAIIAPVFGNDSLEYASAGRIIAQTRSMAHYPFLDGSVTGGLVTPWTHPPGHVTLIALAFIFMGGDVTHAEAVKLLAPYFAIVQALLLIVFASRNGMRAAGFVAAALTLAAPLYFNATIQNGIDPMRLATFAAAVASTWVLLRRPTASNAIICGLVCGCAGFTHSIGMFTLALILPAYLILDRGAFAARVRNSAIIAVIGLAFVAPTLLTNLAVFHNPIQDQSPAWLLPQLEYSTHLAIERALETPAQIVTFGLLRGFSEPETFGYAFWAAAAAMIGAVIIYARRRQLAPWIFPPNGAEPDPAVLSLLILGGFFGVLLLSVAAGSLVAVKNPRYLATILPLASLAAGRLLTAPLARRAAT
jgi:hypothetical protein